MTPIRVHPERAGYRYEIQPLIYGGRIVLTNGETVDDAW